ncbi:hypothetical protein [Kribbella sindirgiensis]|uniref:Uncharacterized protein n=1 Tax=Kribbella sindirgiensis TaxID=1124744 RepID=A0A4R0I077_9ACTN|nr:hypothetical protein [Kribbella sindirgiensis]TCC19968.1 hypothetical protein E0H50_37725 [Kribbella sindirgiensis]
MSATTEIIKLAGPFVAGGGMAGAVAAYAAWKKGPAEKDSIIVNGAETAVVALKAVLEAETARADRAEAERDRALEREAKMEARLDAMQKMLDEARDEIHAWRSERGNPSN